MIPYDVSIRYMVGGYSVILIILFVYLASLILRWRKLKRDMQVLEELDKKQ
jgi:hypothetical protein